MQIGEASRQQDDRPDEGGANGQDAPAHSVPRVASPPGRAPLKSKTRWAACGKCVACTRSDCGDCINCADKAKFGGSGVRKQSCVRRRCLRMNANNAAARHQPSNRGRPDAQPERRGQDVAFWDAVAGITKLNGNTSPSSPDRYDDDGYDSEEDSPRLQRPEPGGVASDFCFKLASVLAADGSLSSQPIALRALQQAGILEASMLQNLAAPRPE